MKKLIILFIFINNLIFPNIFDANSFLSSEKYEKIIQAIENIREEKEINVDILFIDSKIIIDRESFFDKKTSVFVIFTHEKSYIKDMNVFVSPDLRIKNRDRLKLIELSKEFMRLNHHLDETIFIQELLDIVKDFNFENSWSLTYFLKTNIIFLSFVVFFLMLLLMKLLINSKIIEKQLQKVKSCKK